MTWKCIGMFKEIYNVNVQFYTWMTKLFCKIFYNLFNTARLTKASNALHRLVYKKAFQYFATRNTKGNIHDGYYDNGTVRFITYWSQIIGPSAIFDVICELLMLMYVSHTDKHLSKIFLFVHFPNLFPNMPVSAS